MKYLILFVLAVVLLASIPEVYAQCGGSARGGLFRGERIEARQARRGEGRGVSRLRPRNWFRASRGG